MKIGITIANLKRLDDKSSFYSNGINQHIFFLYEYLIKNADVYFISETKSEKNNYKFISHDNYLEMSKLDIILSIGLDIHNNKVKEINKNVKIIFYNMGSQHSNDVYIMLEFEKEKTTEISASYYDEVWISPHFEYTIDYYRYKYKTKNVKVCPFFWDPKFLEINREKVRLINDNSRNIDIGVFEPNLYKEKTCFVPIIACEFAKDYITTAKIFNTVHFKNKSIIKFFNLSELYKSGKLSAEQRYAFSFIMSKYCNVVLSYVENCDLNFLFLECFYLGIPLIHNSKMLKDYGYYYEGCDATGAAEHIKNLKLNGFDRESYIAKHKEVLFKYSLENPEVTSFLNSNLFISDNEKTVKGIVDLKEPVEEILL